MSSLIVCRILASNYQVNNHYNRAGAKCPIFLVMNETFCQNQVLGRNCGRNVICKIEISDPKRGDISFTVFAWKDFIHYQCLFTQ